MLLIAERVGNMYGGEMQNRIPEIDICIDDIKYNLMFARRTTGSVFYSTCHHRKCQQQFTIVASKNIQELTFQYLPIRSLFQTISMFHAHLCQFGASILSFQMVLINNNFNSKKIDELHYVFSRLKFIKYPEVFDRLKFYAFSM